MYGISGTIKGSSGRTQDDLRADRSGIEKADGKGGNSLSRLQYSVLEFRLSGDRRGDDMVEDECECLSQLHLGASSGVPANNVLRQTILAILASSQASIMLLLN